MNDKQIGDIRLGMEMDQAITALTNFARTLAVYRDALRRENFTQAETLALVRDYQSSVLANGAKPRKDDN